jgi:hypothetical protein
MSWLILSAAVLGLTGAGAFIYWLDHKKTERQHNLPTFDEHEIYNDEQSL